MNDSTDSFSTSRRGLILGGAAAAAGVLAPGISKSHAAEPVKKATPGGKYKYCLNTSCIRGQELTIEQEVDIAGKAGYDGIEPWLRKINAFVEGGGKLSDLKKRLDDNGLTVESAIGFAAWIVEDDEARKKGFEEAKRDMDTLAALGAKRIAAPPAGAQRIKEKIDLFKAAERYRELIELGIKCGGVIPQVEVWGFSTNLSRLGESAFVAIESGHEQACLLTDVYHIYKGGSDYEGLALFSPQMLQVMHMNDFPADPPRETIGDADRVYPGDGVAPIKKILAMMANSGAYPVLSLELFNKEYWKQDALEVAKTGLEKMKAVSS